MSRVRDAQHFGQTVRLGKNSLPGVSETSRFQELQYTECLHVAQPLGVPIIQLPIRWHFASMGSDNDRDAVEYAKATRPLGFTKSTRQVGGYEERPPYLVDYTTASRLHLSCHIAWLIVQNRIVHAFSTNLATIVRCS